MKFISWRIKCERDRPDSGVMQRDRIEIMTGDRIIKKSDRLRI